MKKRLVREFIEYRNDGIQEEYAGKAEVFPSICVGLLHSEIGDIITTTYTKEIYVVIPNTWNTKEESKVVRAFAPDNMSEATKYSQEVKEKYDGQELQEEGGEEYTQGGEGTDYTVKDGEGEL